MKECRDHDSNEVMEHFNYTMKIIANDDGNEYFPPLKREKLEKNEPSCSSPSCYSGINVSIHNTYNEKSYPERRQKLVCMCVNCKSGQPKTKKMKHICYIDECREEFRTPSKLRSHIRRCHLEEKGRPFICNWPNCDRNFKSVNALGHHMCFHTEKRNFTCPFCGMKFARCGYLKSHLRLKHLVTHNERASMNQFSCPHCVNNFQQKKLLLRHIKRKHKDLVNPNEVKQYFYMYIFRTHLNCFKFIFVSSI